MSAIVLVSCAALLDSVGRVLISRRHSGAVMPGRWEFPGGKCHQGEKPEMAAVRELSEELSVTTQADCLWPLAFTRAERDIGSLVVLLFVVRRWRGPLLHTLDQPMVWVMPRELRQYDMIPENKILIQALCDHLL